MTNSLFDTAKYVQFGIDAARAGKKTEAREYLKLALQQSPDYVPALFWMAYVAPSPQDSINYLGRILTLEPDNQRAKAGLSWARQQLKQAEATTPADQESAPPEADPDPEMSREDFLSHDEIQRRSQKGVKAHRARRNLNSFLAVMLLLGATALLALSIWALAPMPSDTLAAWLPAAVDAAAALPPQSDAPPAAPPEPVAVVARPAHFTRQADTLNRLAAAPAGDAESDDRTAELPAPETTSQTAASAPPLAAPEVALLTVPDMLASQPAAPAVAPAALFGPVGEAVIGFKLFEPVDESRLAYQPASPDEKWIEVDVTRQTVVAWEGNTPVMAFLSSTGLPGTPTVLGHYNIYWKLESTLMSGPGYYLPDVPYTMYFHGGYALHGAYWHDNFGQPMSHGCVNLRNDNAKKLFNWADPVVPEGQTQVTSSGSNPGTLVVVHE